MSAPETSIPVEKGSKLLPVLLVPIAAGIWLASRAAYYEGFAESLGIPDTLSVAPPITVSSAVFEFTFMFVFLNGLIVFVQAFGLVRLAQQPIVENLLATLVLTAFFGLGGLAVLIKQWPNLFGSGFAILLLLLCLLFWWLIWIQPLISHRDADGYRAKLRKGQEEHRKMAAKVADDKGEPWDLMNLVRDIGGRAAALVLMLFILVPTAGYHLGEYVGGIRTEWLSVESPEIPPDAKHDAWIVLGEQGDRVLVAPTRTGVILNHYRLISSSSATFQRVELGELETEEASQRPE